MYGMNSRGFRLKVGLDALSNRDETNEQVAARYAADGVGQADVVRCRQEAKDLHGRMTQLHGPRYFANMGLARKPDSVLALLAM